MRCTCPHCHQRFDVSFSEVLKEAERLRERAKSGKIPENAREGNVIDPADREALRQRGETIKRRLRT